MRGASARALLAAVVGAVSTVVALASPAQAAACARGTGVTVVVGSSVRCDANGGGRASSNFADAGHSLKYIGNGFVCQVDGSPTECKPPNNDYWSLWWSDGTSGRWTYSTSGVGGLTVPTGGWVAFRFQNNGSKIQPGVHPVAPAPAPKPKPKPAPTKAATKPTATPTPTASSSASAKDEKKKPSASSPSASATDDASAGSEQVRRTGQEVEDSGSSTLWWAGGAIALLLAFGLVMTVVQRRGKES